MIKRTLLAIVLATALLACEPQPPTPNGPCTNGDRPELVYEFGDSLSLWAGSKICQKFVSSTDVDLSLNAVAGARVDHYWPTFPNVATGSCVLVFLGTNDLISFDAQTAKWYALAALNQLRDAGAETVVWGLLDEHSAGHRGHAPWVKTREYNAFLRQLVTDQTYGDLLTLYDWSADAWGHDEYLLLPNDPIHHSDAGVEAYSDAIVAAQQNCV